MKLGYIFLFVVYTSSFAIGITLSKDVFYSTDVQHVTFQQRYQNNLNKVSDFVMDSIGMSDFVEELNKGM